MQAMIKWTKKTMPVHMSFIRPMYLQVITRNKFKLLSILPWRIHTANAIHVIGDFIIFRTIYLPSDLTWRLEGTTFFGSKCDTGYFGLETSGAITEKKGGACNILMSGGLYRGR